MSARRPRRPPSDAPTAGAAMRTEELVSAGGVVVREIEGRFDVVLVLVGAQRRWQLPKGIVEAGETPEAAARREVGGEGGVDAEPAGLLDVIDYWYVGDRRGERVRFHKRVHFFLFRYQAGRVEDHDDEVHEARWVPLADAAAQLAFANERRVVERAATLVTAAGESKP